MCRLGRERKGAVLCSVWPICRNNNGVGFWPEGVQRDVVAGVVIVHKDVRPIVEDEPAIYKAGGNDAVVLLKSCIPHKDETEVARRNAGLAQGEVFGEGVILALAHP